MNLSILLDNPAIGALRPGMMVRLHDDRWMVIREPVCTVLVRHTTDGTIRCISADDRAHLIEVWDRDPADTEHTSS
jgi:hypothetical protein